MNAFFNIKRFGLIMRRELLMNYRNYLMVSAFIFGIFFLVYFISIAFGEQTDTKFDTIFFYTFMMIGGAFYTSMTFADVKRPVGYFYLTIPASNFEKVLSKWIVTLIGWVIAYTIVFAAFSLMGKFLYSILHGATNNSLTIVTDFAFTYFRFFILMHAIFFLGASVFKKNAFILTIIGLAAVVMALGFVSIIFFKIFGIDPEIIETIIKDLPGVLNYGAWVLTFGLWAWAFNRLHKTQL